MTVGFRISRYYSLVPQFGRTCGFPGRLRGCHQGEPIGYQLLGSCGPGSGRDFFEVVHPPDIPQPC